jgi:CRISPR-associated protein Csc1
VASPDHVVLDNLGLRLYAGRMYNHDYLWFSSFEISKTAATIPIIHNYALTYAISGYSYGIYFGHAPRYSNDLARMPAYATPALPEGRPGQTRFTQNAINSRTLRTDDAPRGSNSPAFGWRLVLDPNWSRSSQDLGAFFSFYLFARSEFHPSAIVRLGKKGCPIRLHWEEITNARGVLVESVVAPTHAVNPLDVAGEIVSYEPVPLPPHLVLRRAEIRQDWFVFSGAHRIHIPRRVLPERGEGP